MKLIILSAALLLSLGGSSQASNNAFFNFDLGISIPRSPADKAGGFGLYIEPKFNVTNHVAAGFKLEGMIIFGSKVAGLSYAGAKITMGAMSSMALTGDYIFLEESFRPFAGFGIGRYKYAAQSTGVGGVSVTQEAGKSWGICPRLGIHLGAFRIACEYNWLFKSGTYAYQEVGSGSVSQGVGSTGKMSRSYFGFKIGAVIGFKNK